VKGKRTMVERIMGEGTGPMVRAAKMRQRGQEWFPVCHPVGILHALFSILHTTEAHVDHATVRRAALTCTGPVAPAIGVVAEKAAAVLRTQSSKGRSGSLLFAGPCGSTTACPARVAYRVMSNQSLHHSHTLPAMSYRPRGVGRLSLRSTNQFTSGGEMEARKLAVRAQADVPRFQIEEAAGI
jgi:hypothetical protein